MAVHAAATGCAACTTAPRRPTAPTGKVVVEVDAAPEVRVETVERDDARLGQAGPPVDRVAAQAWAAFERATVVSVPAGAVARRRPC